MILVKELPYLVRCWLNMYFKCVLGLLFGISYCQGERPRVTTPSGAVLGHAKTSFGGREFAAFEGIPYAKPPIGKRRFQPPEARPPWEGEWDAAFLVECSQTVFMQRSNVTKGTEDCLYINVYVPHLKPSSEQNLPVIVHIHGGAFFSGSGHSYANPSYIMDRDVIFVTFNYRLGIFGFLSTGDDVVSGNNGLKDQVLALKWLQSHIRSFGGDPASITLTGASSGATCVHLHYFSTMSRGLFHRGFSNGGVSVNPWAFQNDTLEGIRRLAEVVGCPTSLNKVLVKCLRGKPANYLLRHNSLFIDFDIFELMPTIGPVIENGTDAFLKEDPYVLLREGKIEDLPWVVSNTAHEGLAMGSYFFNKMEYVLERWENLAPKLLIFKRTVPQNSWNDVSEKIRNFYFVDNNDTNPEMYLKLAEIFSDRYFRVGAQEAVVLQSEVTTSPVYYYYFSYPGDGEAKVVPHGADLRYLFEGFLDPTPLTPNEIKLKEIFLDMLVSFARTGKPTIEGVQWEPVKSDQLTYLHIDGFEVENMKLETVEELAPRRFWKILESAQGGSFGGIKDEF